MTNLPVFLEQRGLRSRGRLRRFDADRTLHVQLTEALMEIRGGRRLTVGMLPTRVLDGDRNSFLDGYLINPAAPPR